MLLLIVVSSIASFSLGESGYIHVYGASKIQYQLTSSNKVYFRNLNQFNEKATGCCYAFYLDLNTEFGKNSWALFLMLKAQMKPLSMYVKNFTPPTHGGAELIDHVGQW